MHYQFGKCSLGFTHSKDMCHRRWWTDACGVVADACRGRSGLRKVMGSTVFNNIHLDMYHGAGEWKSMHNYAMTTTNSRRFVHTHYRFGMNESRKRDERGK
jgi:hypothetical protein